MHKGVIILGINVNVYTYWGVRTEWNDEVSENREYLYNQKIDPRVDVNILIDSMSGDYMVFGIQLYDSGDSRWGEMTNSHEIDISDAILEQIRVDYMSRFKLLYPEQFEWLNEKKWKLVNLVHYS